MSKSWDGRYRTRGLCNEDRCGQGLQSYLSADIMRRCRHIGGQLSLSRQRNRLPLLPSQLISRAVSEYAPLAPSPNDLKAPLPEKYSVGKNLKLKVVYYARTRYIV